MPLPFLPLAPYYPRTVDIFYEATVKPCTDPVPECIDCVIYDPYLNQPSWDTLIDSTAMVPITIYGTLGFSDYAMENST